MANLTINSVRQRWILLGSILDNPKKLPRQISDACKSQGALAKLELPQEGVFKMTLNTLKATARIAIEKNDGKDGWEQLEERRLSVQSLVVKHSQLKQSARKKPTDNLISDLQEALDKSNRQRLRLERGYFEMLTILRELAKSDPSLEVKLKRHLATFSIRTLVVLDGGIGIEDT